MKLKRRVKKYFFLLFFFLLSSSFFGNVSAEFFSGTATQFKIEDTRAQPGDIISVKNGKLTRSSSSYDNDIFGVIATNPMIVIGREETKSAPIITSGITLVKVDSGYEEIKKGDFITSSEKPGIGKKAPYDGFVVGRSLEDFDGGEGLIEVFVDPREIIIEDEVPWEEMTFWEAIGRIVKAVERDVPQILRYLLATLLVAGSFVFGLYSFSRTLKDGIKGISRNPLAKGSIRFAMTLNLIGILVVTVAALALALFIILL